MPIKTILTMLVLSLAFCSSSFAQTAEELGLVLKVTNPSGNADCKNARPGLDCIQRRLIFENNGRSPVIIIDPTKGFGTGIKTLVSYTKHKDRQTNAEVLIEYDRRDAIPDPDEDASLRSVLPLFDDERPPQNLVRIIQPGDTFSFEESFLVPSNAIIFRNDDEKRELERRFEQRAYERNLETSHLTLRCFNDFQSIFCRPWNLRYEMVYEFRYPNPAIIEQLAIRWKAHGKIPIGPAGTYTITSEKFWRS